MLLLWTFEIQLLMQIIVNRIAIIAEHQDTVTRLKWGTAFVITCINIAVFCIWIPSHIVPPASELYVKINEIWDRISKVLILLVDAGLNYYFLRTVKRRLVLRHGLTKYAPLVAFNARLMVVSILMDALLIGLMSLPNQIVYIQFHPVTYMVKLNIEMTMADLITKLARGENSDTHLPSTSNHRTISHEDPEDNHQTKSYPMHTINKTKAEDSSSEELGDLGVTKVVSPHGRLNGVIQVETVITSRSTRNSRGERERNMAPNFDADDEYPLAHSGSDDGTRHSNISSVAM
ncbi:hypothetical protein J3459_016730 [Metarhizium acridum]|nr:hypothetical protein J3459_016730 [Metarhizium acridum]